MSSEITEEDKKIFYSEATRKQPENCPCAASGNFTKGSVM